MENEEADWFNTGFDALDNEENWQPQFEESNFGPRRVWMKPGQTQRLLYLDDNPFTFWEQQFKYGKNGWRNWLVHLTRNKIAERHPMDDVFEPGNKDDPSSISFVGYLSVLNLTGYKRKKGDSEELVNCYVELHGTKAGSKKNPGVLHKLKRLKKKHDGLTGVIFDVYRAGEQSPNSGDDFDDVTHLEYDKEGYARYFKGKAMERKERKAGNIEKADELQAQATKVWNKAMAPITEHLRENYGFKGEKLPEPIDYRTVFEPMSVEDMQKLADTVAASRGKGGAAKSKQMDEDVGYEGGKTKGAGWADDDDDIPF